MGDFELNELTQVKTSGGGQLSEAELFQNSFKGSEKPSAYHVKRRSVSMRLALSTTVYRCVEMLGYETQGKCFIGCHFVGLVWY